MPSSRQFTQVILRFTVLALTASWIAACAEPDPKIANTAVPAPNPKTLDEKLSSTEPEAIKVDRPSRRVSDADQDPDTLIGLDRAALRALLGVPPFVRRDSAAQLWRYRNKNCVLHLFLYRNGNAAAGKLTVRHYEVRDPVGAPVAARSCLSALLTQRRKDISG